MSNVSKVVKDNKIIVFMKGSKDFPQCGFSNTVVQVGKKLRNDSVDYGLVGLSLL